MAATSRQCAITLLPNNVEMCFWCLHLGFSHPGNQFRAVITSIFNISQIYREKTNVAPGKRHIVVQSNNNDLFNKVTFRSRGKHIVKMFRLLTKDIL